MPETLSLHGEKPNRKVKRNLDMLRTGAGGHCVRLAATALGQFAEVTRSVQQGPLRSRVAEAAVAVHHYHLPQNHPGCSVLVPPSEI